MLSVLLRYTDSDYPFWYLQTILTISRQRSRCFSSINFSNNNHEFCLKMTFEKISHTFITHIDMTAYFSGLVQTLQ